MISIAGVIGAGLFIGYLRPTSGAIEFFVSLVIALSQLRVRRELDAAGVQPAPYACGPFRP
jgi:GABA permease